MLKKWLLPGALVLALALLGWLAPWWWPRLLDLAGTHSARIEGLAGLVQIILWLGAAVVAVVRFWLRRKPQAAEFPARRSLTARGRSSVAVDGGVASGQAAVGGDVHGNVNAIERLEVNVEAPDARDFLRGLGLGPPAPDLEEAARAYLQFLVAAYQYLDLRGMGISDRVALKLPLLEMYVPLKARLHTPEGETWARQPRVAGRPPGTEEGADMGERLSAPVPVLDLLQKHDGLVLLGDPGAGKTTFLKVLALALASGQGETLGLGGRLPILLPLAAYANALADRDVSLDAFIARYYEDERKIQVPLGALLERGPPGRERPPSPGRPRRGARRGAPPSCGRPGAGFLLPAPQGRQGRQPLRPDQPDRGLPRGPAGRGGPGGSHPGGFRRRGDRGLPRKVDGVHRKGRERRNRRGPRPGRAGARGSSWRRSASTPECGRWPRTRCSSPSWR